MCDFIHDLERQYPCGDSRHESVVVEKNWAERLRQQTPTHDRASIEERSI